MILKMGEYMQYLAVFTSTINMISYGMAFGWPSPSLPKLFASDSPIKIESNEGSWLTVMPFIGALIGAPFASILADKYGRKTIILLTGIPMLISWIIIGTTNNLWGLLTSRILCGIGGSSLFTVIPSYIAEITQPKLRGQLGAMLTWMWNLGVFIIYAAGPFLSIQLMGLVSISIPVIFFATFYWMPESPYFYLMINKTEQARKSLRKFNGDQDIEERFSIITKDIEEQMNIKANALDIVVNPVNRKTLLLILTLITVQELSGRAPFMFYSQIIFQEVDKAMPAAYITMIYGLVQLLSSFFSSLIVDKYGRKTLLLISCVGSALCLIIEGTFFYLKSNYDLKGFEWIPAANLILFIILFTVGLGVVPMIMAGEMFSTSVKTCGLCVVDLYVAAISIAISKFYQSSSAYFGIFVPFWTFSVCCALGIFFIKFYLPETKGLTLEEIQNKLKKTMIKIK